MPFYRYWALDVRNQTLKGELNADSDAHIQRKLKLYNLRPLSIKRMHILSCESFTDIDRFDICLSIAELLKAGVPLAEALKAIHHDQRTQKRRILCKSFEEGLRYGEGMNAFQSRDFFDDVALLSLLQAEKTGDLTHSFETLAHYYLKRHTLRNEWLRMIRYPIFLGIMLLILIGILGHFVLPNLEHLIPHPSRGIAFHSFRWFTQHLHILAACLFGLLSLTFFWRRFLYRIPIIYRCRMGAFWESLAFCLSHDIPLLSAIDLSKMNIPYSMRTPINTLYHYLHNGKSLSAAFTLIPHMPNTLYSLIALAEKTGDIIKIMIHFSKMEKTFKENLIKKLISWTQPLLILIMGLVVLWILNATIVPLYDSLADFTD